MGTKKASRTMNPIAPRNKVPTFAISTAPPLQPRFVLISGENPM
jgi:hypothetical protein